MLRWRSIRIQWKPLRVGRYIVRRNVLTTLILLLCYGIEQLLMPARLHIPYTYGVEALRFSPDGRWLAIQQTNLDIWSIQQNRIEHTLPCQWLNDIAWRDDGSRFACAIADGVGIWDTNTWQRIMVLPLVEADTFFHSIRWSPDGQRIGTILDHSAITMWDANTGLLLWSKPSDGESWGWGWFLPDGVYVTHRTVALTQAWDAQGHEVEKPELPGEMLASSHDRRLLALRMDREGQFGVWNILEKRMVSVMVGHLDHVNDAAFSPDDRMLVTVSGSSESGVTDITDQVVRVWSTEDGSQIRTFHSHSGVVSAVDWSPDGQIIVSGSRYVAVNRWVP